ncbi:hypothetical protein DPX16_20380 [Anabarilius grahami]|uniref:Uncharacterized protein n=1 Tax=Anabarilius grahami TaxID=495550 RepID=A0A3N0XKV6_ANAGA|nr:hypothetical protein DPX16_20380 [Anabarilius grahami]
MLKGQSSHYKIGYIFSGITGALPQPGALGLSPETERNIKRPRMAQASQDQGAVGVADPDEDSPNMIAYRKTNTQSSVMAWKSLLENESTVLLSRCDPCGDG